MIVLFTDFGLSGPYIGQMKAVLARLAPQTPVIDLFSDAPAYDPRLSAYLLAAYASFFKVGDVFLCVVDPGVGTERQPVVVRADGRWYVGPDNGLFALVIRRAAAARAWRIDWRPDKMTPSFHGRDLFAPVAAHLTQAPDPPGSELTPSTLERADWPDELPRIVYIDRYGNAITGLRGSSVPATAVLTANGVAIHGGRTFGDVGKGAPLWYVNSNGLVEIAVNQGRAAITLGLAPGSPITVTSG